VNVPGLGFVGVFVVLDWFFWWCVVYLWNCCEGLVFAFMLGCGFVAFYWYLLICIGCMFGGVLCLSCALCVCSFCFWCCGVVVVLVFSM